MSIVAGQVVRKPTVNGKQEPRTREPKDYAKFVLRILRAMGKRAAEADPESLVLFAEMRRALDLAERRAMEALHNEGYSLAEIGRPLGISKVAVHKRLHRDAA